MRRLAVLLTAFVLACGTPATDDSGSDAGTTTTDAGSSRDAGTTDAGSRDAGTTDAGTTDAGTTDAGTTDEPYSCEAKPTDDACDTCQKGSCCSATKACFDDPRCDAYFRCANPCPDTACAEACEDEHPAGFLLFVGWYQCLQQHCPGQCLGD